MIISIQLLTTPKKNMISKSILALDGLKQGPIRH